MQRSIAAIAVIAACLFALSSSVTAQVTQPGDMQQRLEQEMTNTKRSAADSSASAGQNAPNMKSEAEKKMEDTARQHKSQAEGQMTEEIEKAKRKAQGMGQ